MLHLPGDPDADLARERALAQEQANRAIAARVEEVVADERLPPEEATQMRAWAAGRNWRGLTERLERRGGDAGAGLARISDWRHELVGIERDVFVGMRNSGTLSEEVLRELEYDLDLEEALLDRRVDDATGHLDQLRAERLERDGDPDR